MAPTHSHFIFTLITIISKGKESIYKEDAQCALHIDLSTPVVSRADIIISASLDVGLGSIGQWHFKTDTNKFYIYEVVDEKNSEVSTFFLETIIYIYIFICFK